MSIVNGKIQGRGVVIAPNGSGDLQVALGSSRMSKAWFFSTANINRWALRKPVIHSQVPGPLTDAQMQEANCGLSPISMPRLLQESYGIHSGTYTKAQCLAQAAVWTYNRPNGETGQARRTFDFYSYSENGVGYNPAARPTDSGWAGRQLTASDLTTLAGVSVTVGGTQPTNFILTPSTNAYYYTFFNCLFGTSSAQRHGDVSNVEIPLTWVLGLTDADYRIALAVWAPWGPAGSWQWGWQFFIGRNTIKRFLNTSNPSPTMIFPDFATNPVAADGMKRYTTANGYTEFDAIPVFVKGIRYNSNDKYPYFSTSDTGTAVYCMPSGGSVIKIGCGTSPITVYGRIYQDTSYSPTAIIIENTGTSSHSFKYSIVDNGEERIGEAVSMAAGEKRQIGTVASGHTVTAKIIEQDGQPV